MNLQFHLLIRIVVSALTCLLACSCLLLYHIGLQTRLATEASADQILNQLEYQLVRINAGLSSANQFPDFEIWKQSDNAVGFCASFTAVTTLTARSVCNGAKVQENKWPMWFTRLYERLFKPDQAVVRELFFDNRLYGHLVVTASSEMQLAAAWDTIRNLFILCSMTIFSVIILVYLTVRQALNPVLQIVAGLQKLQAGQLDYRLPTYRLHEWRRIAAAINQLSASQQLLLQEQHRLSIKLMCLQEEERRYLARELHDEQGQCLAAINALSVSIRDDAGNHQSDLRSNAMRISEICNSMQERFRSLLCRLRPVELDELGLPASLNSLIASWRASSNGNTIYQLEIAGDFSILTEEKGLALFRITQESLTNIAKHASASLIEVRLQADLNEIALIIKDNGVASVLPFTNQEGIGILGMKERMAALHGQLDLRIADPHGLIVEARCPLSLK
jgi:two-component system, NarL family, sensor histidine kinase UhpB